MKSKKVLANRQQMNELAVAYAKVLITWDGGKCPSLEEFTFDHFKATNLYLNSVLEMEVMDLAKLIYRTIEL